MADSTSPVPAPLVVPSNDGNPITALSRLLGSSKGIVVALVVVGTYAALFLRRVEWAQVEHFLTVIIPAWMGAQTVEEAAKHFAAGKVAAAQASGPSTSSTVINTVAPTPADGGA